MRRMALACILCAVAMFGCREDMLYQEIGTTSAARHVLIAGEQTDFKNRVVEEVVDRLDTGEYFFRVAGLDDLDEYSIDEYGAIVLATWYSQGKLADKRAARFVRRHSSDRRIIVFYTHGGSFALPAAKQPKIEVDAVGSPSRNARVARTAKALAARIEARF